MFDNWYGNIGGKIKTWAKWIFIVEAISSIITGIALLVDTEEVIYILFCLVGPVVAFVSSWLLYGFGELIEKTTQNERNTRYIYHLLYNKENNEEEPVVKTAPPVYSAPAQRKVISSAPISSYEAGFWICRKCNSKNAAASRYCKNCGEYK